MITVASLLLGLSAGAAEVEVGPNDDVRTLTAALGPGTEFVFADGVYELEGAMEWSGQGTEGDPITMRAAINSSPVFRLSGGNQVVNITEASHMIVRGLTFEGADEHYEANGFNGIRVSNSNNISIESCATRRTGRSGIVLDGDTTAVTIIGIHVSQVRDGHGVYVGCGDASCFGTNNLIETNWIHDIGGDYTYGVIIQTGGQGNIIRDNIIYEAFYGIAVYSAEYGDPNQVQSNAVWSVADDGIVASGAAVVQNNVIFDAGDSGINSGNDNGALQDLVITHNTIANTGSWGIRLQEWAGKSGMVLANNAVANPVGAAISASSDGTAIDASNYISSNVVTGYVEGFSADEGHFMPGGGLQDFVDASNWDFYPTSYSALKDAGDNAAEAWVPQTDFNGDNRDGTSPTVGAYEWAGDSNPGWQLQEGFKTAGAGRQDEHDVSGGCCGKSNDEADEAMAVAFAPLLIVGFLVRRRRDEHP
jgi:hypothetical protein